MSRQGQLGSSSYHHDKKCNPCETPDCDAVRTCLASALGLPDVDSDLFLALRGLILDTVANIPPAPIVPEVFATDLVAGGTAIGPGGTVPLTLSSVGGNVIATLSMTEFVPAAGQPVLGGTLILTGPVPASFQPSGSVAGAATPELTTSGTVESAGVPLAANIQWDFDPVAGTVEITIYDPADVTNLGWPAGLVDPVLYTATASWTASPAP